MSDSPPRLRMFAGPNGSGKTTVKNELNRPIDWFGLYINPDDLESSIRQSRTLSLSQFNLRATTAEVRQNLSSSPLLLKHRLDNDLDQIVVHDNAIEFGQIAFNSYHASAIADFLRRKALDAIRTFSFETVMSSRDKVSLLKEAQSRGYRTYLYYIATEDPAINVQRVRNRVEEGGHNVPEEKIKDRYVRSLGLLREAIQYSNRAFLFDTSEEHASYFAEVTDNSRLELKLDIVPNWFRPIWEQF